MENDLIERKKNVAEVNTMSPLTWAYVGDAVFELLIRTHLINKTRLKPHMLHIEAIKYVKADAQVEILRRIEKELSMEEMEIVRRGRNAQNHHVPKNATVEEYSYATAFEALIGYLYLTKQDQRLKEILDMCINEN
jgi:ribonuclease III